MDEKAYFVQCLELITFAALTNEFLTTKWQDIVKLQTVPASLLKSYSDLVTCSGFHFFSAYLKMRLSTNKAFRELADTATTSQIESSRAFGQGVLE